MEISKQYKVIQVIHRRIWLPWCIGHILDEDRKINAQKLNDTFYKNFGNGIDHVKNAKKEVDIDSLVDALKHDPRLMAQLIEALK